jgi:putative YhdH/YhfP family quinone oxidoreductase
MQEPEFRAFVVDELSDGTFVRKLQIRNLKDLPNHDVLVRVHYSSLNYKDMLSATGNKGVTRTYPHTPGIDAAGIVVESRDERFQPGDEVIVTSYDLGQNTPGGFGEFIRVPGDWIVPLPAGLSLRESMILGTAGFTAAYGVYKIMENHVTPDNGPILVTGATGGVGSLAVTLLAGRGFHVIAATGKTEHSEFLQELGVQEIISREQLMDNSEKPLLTGRWAGVLDTVGGAMLDASIRQTRHNGMVACCGNVLGGKLETSIYPFILRGVGLLGIDSGICLMSTRKKIWGLLAGAWKPINFELISRECGLADLEQEIQRTLHGQQIGRVLIRLKN